MCGGIYGENYLNTCERYSFTDNVWEMAPQVLPIGMEGASAVSHEHYLYIVGGYDGNYRNNLIRCDIRAGGSCEEMSPMSERRGYSGSALRVRDGVPSIVVCGGSYQTQSLSSCESYNINDDTWTSFPAMTQRRRYFTLIEWRGRLFAIGGYDGRNRLDNIEEYDDNGGHWELLESKLPRGRSQHAITVY